MEILDCDMQMVREYLVASNAPEYIKGHFDNLLSEYEKAQNRVEELDDRVRELKQEESKKLIEALDERDAALDRLDEIEGEGMRDTLEKVRYWLLDSLVHHKPVKDPRQVLRLVEEALLV